MMTTELDKFLEKAERVYTSVIPGVMDSGELDDMRKCLSIIRELKAACESGRHVSLINYADIEEVVDSALARCEEIARGEE